MFRVEQTQVDRRGHSLSGGGERPSIARRILMFPLTRIVIAVGVFFAVQASLAFGAVTLFGGGAQGTTPAEFFGEHQGIALAIKMLVPVAALMFVVKLIERRPLSAVGLGLRGGLGGTAKGIALGAAMMSAVIGILAIAGWYEVVSLNWLQPGALGAVLVSLAVYLAASVYEEVLFRGILFRILEEGLGSWLALTLTAVFFGLTHMGSPNASLLGAFGVALAGVLFAAIYMRTRSLWFVIGLHWAWNFFEGTVFGAPVSGLAKVGEPLTQATIDGPALWTGGAFGPEAGLVAYVIVAVVTVAALVLAVRRGRTVVPRWMNRARAKRAVHA